MIRSLRIFFLSRLLREKLLLVAFAGLAVAIWLSSFSTRAGQFIQSVKTASSTLETQAMWMSRQAEFEAAAVKAAEQLDPARTLDGIRLYSEISRLVIEAGIPAASLANPQPKADITSGQFSIHTLEFTLNNVEWGALKAFYTSVLARAPYLSVRSFRITPRGNQHVISMQVSAIENTPSVENRR